MKRSLTFIRSKLAFLAAISLATMVGGLATAAVMAAIPDSGGTIHGCYSNGRGILSVVVSPSQSCGAGETSLNWNQNGAKPIYDASNQFIGTLLTVPGEGASSWAIYNPTLNRVLLARYANGPQQLALVSPSSVGVYFESNDCTGQAYATDNSTGDVKTHLIRVNSSSYGIVQNNTSSETKTISSWRHHDSDAGTFNCDSDSDFTSSVYEISSASLPFTAPLERPLKF